MRIAVDMISAGAGYGSSAGAMVVYYSGLLRRMCALPDVSSLVVFTAPWTRTLSIPASSGVEVVTCRGLPRNRVGRVLYEHAVLPWLVRRQSADVLLSTCNVKPLFWRGASVTVLQSLQYLHYPNQFGRIRSAYLKWAVRQSMRTTDAVITVTNWARDEAIRLLPLDSTHVTTVHHGLSDPVREATLSGTRPPPLKLVGDRPYVLMVSTLYGFKNHRRLLIAFAEVVKQHQIPHQLVLVGQDADVTRKELAALASDLGIQDRLLLPGGIPHDQIPSLIANADAVAYPSLYETFGLPILEAMAFGRPLVTSSGGATGEVAGDAAHLVEPTNVAQLASALAEVLLDDALRSRLAESGPTRAAAFTWEKCAEQTASVLRHAIARHGEPSGSLNRVATPDE